MKVYRVKSDVNNFRWLLPDVSDSENLKYTTFECKPVYDDWKPPPIVVWDGKAIDGNFAHLTGGALVVEPCSLDLVRPFFEAAGEILPLTWSYKTYSVLNVTFCVDALDNEMTEWNIGPDGSRVSIKKPYFNAEILSNLRSSIFKIPETCRGSILTWELEGNPDTEFKAFVEENRLTGLIFEKIWES